MYQYDDATAVPAMPVPAVEGSPGFFTDGNPVAGQPATILRADFLNVLMMELLNVLQAAGVSPVKGTDNQLLAAIEILVAPQGSATPNGWIKLPFFGLILQWGTFDINFAAAGTSSTLVSLPEPFPNTFFGVIGTPITGTPSAYSAMGCVPSSLAKFNGYGYATAPNPSQPYFFCALGN